MTVTLLRERRFTAESLGKGKRVGVNAGGFRCIEAREWKSYWHRPLFQDSPKLIADGAMP